MSGRRSKAQRKAKEAAKWHPVTNGLVASFAVDDCPRCKGEGVINTGVPGVEEQICRCANEAFQLRYPIDGDLKRLKVQDGIVLYRP